MRLAAICLAGTLLGACNMIVTERPLFTAADAGMPPIRDGIWLVDDPDCAVDVRQPAKKWPECAQWMVVRGDRIEFPGDLEPGTPFAEARIDSLITGGEPRVWQLTLSGPDKAGEDSQLNVYSSFEATKTDRRGRVVAYRSWPALCGPPPPPVPKGQEERLEDLVTKSPFPGVVMHKGAAGCTAPDQATLRGALTASRDLDEIKTGRWIRDADR